MIGINREAVHDSFINDNSEGVNDNSSNTQRLHAQKQIKRER